MLVITRKVEQTIQIGDDITIIVCPGSRPERMSIGIEAPRHVIVHRGEVYEAIKRSEREAAARAVKESEAGDE